MIDLIFSGLPQVHGGGDHQGIGAVKGLEAFLTFLESLTTKSPEEIFAAFMPGISILDNIHPLLVHFPIALLVTFFLIDGAGTLLSKLRWREVATPLLYIGTLAAAFTVIAGFQAAYSAPHTHTTHVLMLRHQAFGISVAALAIILSIRRHLASYFFLESKTYGHFALSGILVMLLILGADLGGLMVYHHGVAVTPVMQYQKRLEQIKQRHYPTPKPQNHSHSTPHSHAHDGHQHTH